VTGVAIIIVSAISMIRPTLVSAVTALTFNSNGTSTLYVNETATNFFGCIFVGTSPSVGNVLSFNSGGTAQNTVVNTKLKERFPNLIIPPHCPDDGLSLGCIELLRQLNDQPLFDRSNFPYWQSDIAPDELPSQETIDKTAEYLAQGKIVGWYQGHGEIGPRALGNRSILMDPSIKLGKDVINAKVKRREAYRPFGASVLLEDTSELFDCDYDSPYMLYVVKCKKQEEFPAIIHVDNTCRIQTVNQDPQNEVYHNLISTFKKRTGIPMLLNTSLNIDGKPIAGDPSDAHKLFEISDLDVVVVGNTIRLK